MRVGWSNYNRYTPHIEATVESCYEVKTGGEDQCHMVPYVTLALL